MNSSPEEVTPRMPVSIKRYIKRIVEEYDNENSDETTEALIDPQLRYGVGEHYVVPAAIREKNGDILDPIDPFIESWLSSSDKNPLVVLGDYGAGKSALCWNICSNLAKELLRAHGSGRIPIYIHLKKQGPIENIRSFILRMMTANGINISLEEFDQLIEADRLFIAFDAFDELDPDVTGKETISNWREILKICEGKVKAIITCRSAFFKSTHELEATIQGESLQLTGNHFEILHLQDWSTPKIEKYLAIHWKGNWKYYWNRATSMHRSLAYLARRPLFLMVMVKLVPELIQKSEGIKLYNLFSIYVKEIMRREADLSNLEEHSKTNILEDIALYLVVDPSVLGITNEQLTAFIINEFKDGLDSSKERAKYHNDVRNSGFLNRVDGQYKFSNSLFKSYFAAQRFAKDIESYNRLEAGGPVTPHDQPAVQSLKANLRKIVLDRDCVAFLASMLQREKKSMEHSIERLLKELINSTKRMRFINERYLGGNAITVLSFNKNNLDGEDFSFTILRKATLSAVSLEKAILTGADLVGVDFDSANLCGASLRGAKLDGASFRGGGGIGSLKVSHDGKYLASGDNAGAVKIWNLDSGTVKKVLDGHRYGVWSVCWQPPDGNQVLASGGRDGTVRLWHIMDDRASHILLNHKAAVSCVDFSPDGKLLASCGGDGNIYVNDAYDGKVIWSKEVGEHIHCIRWSPDGESLATASGDHTITIWNHEDKGRQEVAIDKHLDTVWNVSWHPNPKYRLLASGSRDTTIRIWKLNRGAKEAQEIDRFTDPFGHMASVYYVAWSKDGKYIASSGADTKVIVWNWLDRKILFKEKQHQDDVWSLDWSCTENGLLVSGSEDRTIRVWDAEKKPPLRRVIDQLPRCLGMDFTDATGLGMDQIKVLTDAGAINNYVPSWVEVL